MSLSGLAGYVDPIHFAIKNLKQFQQDLEKGNLKRVRTAQTATKVEGFRLMKLLKQQIQRGAPAGQPFDPLSEIAKRRRRASAKGKRALYRLAIPVRYNVSTTSKGGMVFEVGFLSRDILDTYDRKSGGGVKSRNRISKSWARLAALHQRGARIPVTEEMRKSLASWGASLRKKGQNQAAKYFFLKPTTTHVDIPARPIIEPFWRANKGDAERNIMRNFHRKMRGERI